MSAKVLAAQSATNNTEIVFILIIEWKIRWNRSVFYTHYLYLHRMIANESYHFADLWKSCKIVAFDTQKRKTWRMRTFGLDKWNNKKFYYRFHRKSNQPLERVWGAKNSERTGWNLLLVLRVSLFIIKKVNEEACRKWRMNEFYTLKGVRFILFLYYFMCPINTLDLIR